MAERERTLRFSEREDFLNLAGLWFGKVEAATALPLVNERQTAFNRLFGELYALAGTETISPPEVLLFDGLARLAAIAYGVTVPSPEKLVYKPQEDGNHGRFIEIGGPVGVGKTTTADFVVKALGGVKMDEPWTGNPFWELAAENPDFELRKQLFFLLDNLWHGLEVDPRGQILVRDTSVWSDILVFTEAKRRSGIITEGEHRFYMGVVDLLEKIIPRPDLLVMLVPTSPKKLAKGIEARAGALGGARLQELRITRDPDQLEIMTQAAIDAVDVLSTKYHVNVHRLTVDPTNVFPEGSIESYRTLYAIRQELGIWEGVITPTPEEVATEIFGELAVKSGQLFLVTSPSMFAGKSSVLDILKRRLPEKRMLVFQPKEAGRVDERNAPLFAREREAIDFLPIEDNDISGIVKYIIEHKITPAEVPIIGIDEITLLVANANDPIMVISGLNYLMEQGFNVVVTGLDYSFNGMPFTFMDYLHAWRQIGGDERVHEHILGTHCAFCSEPAEVTALFKIGSAELRGRFADIQASLAKFSDPPVLVGDKQYVPVCGKDHPSCKETPAGFERKLMPRSDEEYLRVLREAKVL